MRVLTYVSGILTVIRDELFYSEKVARPSFMVADGFYYEPTLKVVAGRTLTTGEQTAAEEFITVFAFPNPPTPPEPEHCVNTLGEYQGLKVPMEGYTVVATAPLSTFEIWNFESGNWFRTILVDKTTGSILGNGTVDQIPNSAYIPEVLVDLNLCLNCQTYDFVTKTITIDLDKVRSGKITMIQGMVKPKLEALAGKLVLGEFNYWPEQEREAVAHIANATAVTPMLDALFAARVGLDLSKLDLAQKIVGKAAAYRSIYGEVVGTSHTLIKAIEVATTVAELKAIVWPEPEPVV